MYVDERVLQPSTSPSSSLGTTSSALDALVLDAASRQGVACIRSLGRSGLTVAAAECPTDWDSDFMVPGFVSRYAVDTLLLPSFAATPDHFARDVLEFVRRRAPRVVIPASDGSVAALLPHRRQLAARGCVLALAPTGPLELANDKARTLAVAATLGMTTPCTLEIGSTEDLRLLRDVRLPVVLKPTTSWAPQVAMRLPPTMVTTHAQGVAVAERLLGCGVRVLVQQFVPGPREAITLFLAHGEVRAAFAHREIRTTPALGGASVVRASIDLPREIHESSVELVGALGLDGLVEVEFRRDGRGRPHLMEVNARLVGSIGSALTCGVDFPLMLWRHSMGLEVDPVSSYRVGVRMRWLRGDLRWLRESRRSGPHGARPGGLAFASFLVEFLRSTSYDYFDPRDPRPALAEWRALAGAAARNMTGGRQRQRESRVEALSS